MSRSHLSFLALAGLTALGVALLIGSRNDRTPDEALDPARLSNTDRAAWPRETQPAKAAPSAALSWPATPAVAGQAGDASANRPAGLPEIRDIPTGEIPRWLHWVETRLTGEEKQAWTVALLAHWAQADPAA